MSNSAHTFCFTVFLDTSLSKKKKPKKTAQLERKYPHHINLEIEIIDLDMMVGEKITRN